LALEQPCGHPKDNSNAKAFQLALALFRLLVFRVPLEALKPRKSHKLILDGLCLHVLSSFQRARKLTN
jgi:hypothetical protein